MCAGGAAAAAAAAVVVVVVVVVVFRVSRKKGGCCPSVRQGAGWCNERAAHLSFYVSSKGCSLLLRK